MSLNFRRDSPSQYPGSRSANETKDGHIKEHTERQSWTVDVEMTQTKEEVKKDVEQKCCDSKLKRKETV